MKVQHIVSASIAAVLLMLPAGFAAKGDKDKHHHDAFIAGPVDESRIAREVRHQLLMLPYYGVFDLLTLNVDNNDVVTLAGYVLSGSLKKDAEREAKEVKGVKDVQDKIPSRPCSH